jgi:hydroxypyruvate isomerase
MGVKNCKKFEFEKTIYADKYLLNNLNLDDKDVDIKVAELKNRANELRDQISKLRNHHKGMGIDEILEVTLNFVKVRSEPDSDFENIYFPPDSKSP